MDAPISGKLIVISGPSGVGKTTVIEHLLSGPGFERVVTATTRKPRPGERDGIDYHFMPRQEFEAGIRAGRFLEHARVHGNWYGTPREAVERGLEAGKRLILNIDVQGARQVRERARGIPLVTIFLLPPSLEELERRLSRRGTEKPGEVAGRLEIARRELEDRDLFEHRVVNDTIERAAAAIREAINRGPGTGPARSKKTE
jgi:guanylate kinase